jgi:hypothetical protein
MQQQQQLPGMVVIDASGNASSAQPPRGFIPIPEALTTPGTDTSQPPPGTPRATLNQQPNPLTMVPQFGLPGMPRESTPFLLSMTDNVHY